MAYFRADDAEFFKRSEKGSAVVFSERTGRRYLLIPLLTWDLPPLWLIPVGLLLALLLLR